MYHVNIPAKCFAVSNFKFFCCASLLPTTQVVCLVCCAYVSLYLMGHEAKEDNWTHYSACVNKDV